MKEGEDKIEWGVFGKIKEVRLRFFHWFWNCQPAGAGGKVNSCVSRNNLMTREATA
jgi:hypothetical protein